MSSAMIPRQTLRRPSDLMGSHFDEVSHANEEPHKPHFQLPKKTTDAAKSHHPQQLQNDTSILVNDAALWDEFKKRLGDKESGRPKNPAATKLLIQEFMAEKQKEKQAAAAASEGNTTAPEAAAAAALDHVPLKQSLMKRLSMISLFSAETASASNSNRSLGPPTTAEQACPPGRRGSGGGGWSRGAMQQQQQERRRGSDCLHRRSSFTDRSSDDRPAQTRRMSLTDLMSVAASKAKLALDEEAYDTHDSDDDECFAIDAYSGPR